MCHIKTIFGWGRRYLEELLPSWTSFRPQEGCSKNKRPEYRSLNITNLITTMIYLNTPSGIKALRHWIKIGGKSERKRSWVALRYYPVICLTGLTATKTTVRQPVTKLRCKTDTCRSFTPPANTFWKSWFEQGILCRVVRRFRRCANVIDCTYTNLECTAYYTPGLYGIAYCS